MDVVNIKYKVVNINHCVTAGLSKGLAVLHGGYLPLRYVAELTGF